MWLAYTLKVLFRLKKKFKIRKGLGLANFIDRINRKEFSDKSKGEVAELKKILKMEFQEDQKKLKKIFLKEQTDLMKVECHCLTSNREIRILFPWINCLNKN